LTGAVAADDPGGVHLPAVECPRCAQLLSPHVSECHECGAEITLAMRSASAILPELRALRRWLAVLVIGTLLVALILWDHYSSPRWAVPGLSAAAMATPYLVASAVLAVAFALAGRFPLTASLTTLGLFLATWGSTHVLDPASGQTLELTLYVRVIFLLVVLRAVYAGYTARRLREEMARQLPAATVRS
jgi:hypothetical protein